MLFNPNRSHKTMRVVAGALLGGLTLVACASNKFEATDKCEVRYASGYDRAPASYPLGAVTVYYTVKDKLNTAWPYANRGTIEEINGYQAIDVKDFPPVDELSWIARFYSDPQREASSRDVVVAIDTPQTGVLGFTSECISRVVDDNGIPTTLIQLPLSQ